MRKHFLVTAALAGCIDSSVDPELSDPELGETEQEIADGILATSFYRARAAFVGNCTGVRVSPRHVLTALHCNKQVGQNVRLYPTTSEYPSGPSIAIESTRRPGCAVVNSTTDDRYDCGDNFADWMVLRLEADVPSGSPAVLAWKYPGDDVYVTKVGAGEHEGDPDAFKTLMQRNDLTYESSGEGRFYTNQYGQNNGDSGGPIFHGSKVLGIHSGKELIYVLRGEHSSVPFHLHEILERIDYKWPGFAIVENFFRKGTLLEVLPNRSELVCQYACNHTSSCVAYNYAPSTKACYLMSTSESWVQISGWRSSIK